MFWRSPERIKGAVYAIVAASVPTEVCSNDADDWSQLWCYNFLLRFSKELGLPESKACAYVPMILTESPYQSVSCERRGELVKPYLEILNDGDVVILEAYIFVLMFLVEEGFMDGRGRILLRNLLLSLNLSNYDGVWIENILLQYLVAQQVQIDKSKEKRRNKYRYMKIGAVALGAGAVLAVTGGMVTLLF